MFWTQVGLNILKDPQSVELPGLRRLHYEAWITTSADMKYRLEKRDDDLPRKLPAIEREDRKQRLQKNLGFGLKLAGENEPSHALVDLAVEMVETDALKRIPFEKCTSRDQELRGEKVDKRLQSDRDGFLRLTTTLQTASADTSSLLKLQNCLGRRGAAFDIAGLLSFEAHAELVQEFMAAAQSEPVAGFATPSVEQLVEWDVQVWRRVSQLAGASFREHPDGNRPLDGILRRVLAEPRTALLLLPRAIRGNVGRSQADGEAGRIRTLENQLRNLKRQRSEEDRGNDGDGKRRLVRKAVPNETSVIKNGELAGMPYFWEGKNLCFGFNSSKGCKERNIKRGAKCARGFHICGACGSAGCKFVACSAKLSNNQKTSSD